MEEKVDLIQDKGETSITHYQMSLGWFIFQIDVLSFQGPATEWGTPIGGGGFGSVMTGYTYRHRVYAIKRFKVKTLDKDTYT